MQTLVDSLSEKISSKQPTRNSYYSRSHKSLPGFETIDDSFPYPWFELWPEFQKRIFGFTESYEYIAVTDISNYFDAVPLRALRNYISSMGDISEPFLDFLFRMFEEFHWRPDYLPRTGVGLPQLNFDAPRMIAHAFLFDADELLSELSGDDFVRWMDDITIGINDRTHGRQIIGKLDDLLHSKGVRLNTGKTRILTSEQAKSHFDIPENRGVNLLIGLINFAIDTGFSLDKYEPKVKRRFSRFLRSKRGASWSKLTKRYITALRKLSSGYATRFTPDWLENHPDLRESIFLYYGKLGYSRSRFNHIVNYMTDHCHDDASLFSCCNLIVQWKIPKSIRGRVVECVSMVSQKATSSAFTGCMWLLAKYGSLDEIVEFLNEHTDVWRNNAFLARQVAAITPRLYKDEAVVRWVSEILRESGQIDSLRILANLRDVQSARTLSKSDRSYLLPTNYGDTYPLPKVLFGLAVLGGQLPSSDRERIRHDVLNRTDDPWYVALIKKA